MVCWQQMDMQLLFDWRVVFRSDYPNVYHIPATSEDFKT